MKKKLCRICENKILVSSPDFAELCIVCGSEFREMMIAVAELSSELASAYSTKSRNGSNKKQMPGIPMEEIAIRMELNRIKKSENG